MTPIGRPFEYPLRVRYGECDIQGVVFNAHYLAYFDISMTELWRAAFGDYQAMIDRGYDIMVASAELQFRSPARFDDELTMRVAVTRLGNTAIVTRHEVTRSGQLLIEGSMRHVCVDTEQYAKTPIPDWVRDGLAPWTVSDGDG